MSDFSLASLNERHPIIKEIKKHLVKSTGQDITSINTSEKLKKVAGETTKNITFHLAGGQTVGFLFRKNGDIVKVKINKKEQPIAGYLIFDEKSIFQTAITELGEKINNKQRAFELAKARSDRKKAGEIEATVSHKDGKDAIKTTLSKAKQIEQLHQDIEQIDEQIAQKQSQLDLLNKEFEQLSK